MNLQRHQHQVRRRFSAAAANYDAVSTVQDEVATQVLDLVPDSVKPRRILDLGCGTGRLLALAGRRWPTAELVGVDLAEGMIHQARSRFAEHTRTSFVVADATTYRADPFELVLSSSALHWLRPLATGLAHVFSLVAPGGWLAAGLMTESTLHELRAAREHVAPHKISPVRLSAFDEVRRVIASLPGSRLRHSDEKRFDVPYPSARGLLERLHTMGVTSGDIARGEMALNRRELAALIDHYDQRFAHPDGGVKATYSVGFFAVERA